MLATKQSRSHVFCVERLLFYEVSPSDGFCFAQVQCVTCTACVHRYWCWDVENYTEIRVNCVEVLCVANCCTSWVTASTLVTGMVHSYYGSITNGRREQCGFVMWRRNFVFDCMVPWLRISYCEHHGNCKRSVHLVRNQCIYTAAVSFWTQTGQVFRYILTFVEELHS